jgi:acyl-CoA reductase-like NAD-dependent aldehyde dehydrogenase
MASNGTSNGASHNHPREWSTFSTIPLFLDGKEVTTSTTFDVISPVTHKKLYSCASANESDAEAAIASCEKAFPAWSKTKPAFRRDIFLRAAEGFAKRKDECWKYMHEETGSETPMFEFTYGVAIDACKDAAGLIQTIEGSVPTVAAEGSSAVVYKEPYGVVLGIAPW